MLNKELYVEPHFRHIIRVNIIFIVSGTPVDKHITECTLHNTIDLRSLGSIEPERRLWCSSSQGGTTTHHCYLGSLHQTVRGRLFARTVIDVPNLHPSSWVS